MVISLAYVPVAFADADVGKKLFNSKAKKCKTCNKVQGDPTKFKQVGFGIKNVFKRFENNAGDAGAWLKKMAFAKRGIAPG